MMFRKSSLITVLSLYQAVFSVDGFTIHRTTTVSNVNRFINIADRSVLSPAPSFPSRMGMVEDDKQDIAEEVTAQGNTEEEGQTKDKIRCLELLLLPSRSPDSRSKPRLCTPQPIEPVDVHEFFKKTFFLSKRQVNK